MLKDKKEFVCRTYGRLLSADVHKSFLNIRSRNVKSGVVTKGDCFYCSTLALCKPPTLLYLRHTENIVVQSVCDQTATTSKHVLEEPDSVEIA